ncbi:MAG: hypothetical protein ACO395_05110 [Pontimonas sp.]
MSTTTYLHPNHYPEDFCCQVLSLGTANTGIFRNDREDTIMALDSITVLPGAKAAAADTTVSFRVNSAAGAEIVEVSVPTTAAAGATTYNVAYVLNPGDTVFYVGDADVETLCIQFRVRSRVA